MQVNLLKNNIIFFISVTSVCYFIFLERSSLGNTWTPSYLRISSLVSEKTEWLRKSLKPILKDNIPLYCGYLEAHWKWQAGNHYRSICCGYCCRNFAYRRNVCCNSGQDCCGTWSSGCCWSRYNRSNVLVCNAKVWKTLERTFWLKMRFRRWVKWALLRFLKDTKLMTAIHFVLTTNGWLFVIILSATT